MTGEAGMSAGTSTAIAQSYMKMTPGSAALMARGSRCMPHGITRTLSWFAPYPVVFQRGEGSYVYDVDGNRYVDLFSNGLSLMHGHAYPPVERALHETLPRSTAWPGASDAQIEFAELLCRRVPGAELVRFANTGTEATMLAVKLARWVTGRQLVLKGWHAYHGSYDDLEAGLMGLGEMPGRVALAQFGEIDSWRRQLERHADELAAVIVEPIQYTGVVTPPPEGFLNELQELTREAGALFILDDCLMFRLAEGGSAQRFGLAPTDITCLGKWVGGGLPVGAIATRAELMEVFDPADPRQLYHGGSFNGNLLGSVSGKIAVEDLTAGSIDRIDALGDRLRAGIADAAAETGVPVVTPGVGSVFGLYVLDFEGGQVDQQASANLHLAAVTRGVYYGSGGEFGLSTATTDEDVEFTLTALNAAMQDVARAGALRAGI
ncbi:MAG: aspartate aminotransferase family protein [Solirubrobacteraceae bacterium]